MRLISKISFLLLGLSACSKDPDVLTLSHEPPGANCVNGGTRFQVGEQTPQYACDGVAGADGAQGGAGKDGEDGKDGTDGKDGKDGAQGPAGVAGPKGDPGVQGEDGEKGDNGEAGTSSIVDGEDIEPSNEVGGCQYGGTRVVIGLDDDGQGDLDEDEITYTKVLCAGALPNQPECSATIACPAGETCIDAECVVLSECSPTNPCPTGKTCSNGQCIVVPQCTTKQQCDDGDGFTADSCVAGNCHYVNLLCEPNKSCDDGDAGTAGDICAPNGMVCSGTEIPVVNDNFGVALKYIGPSGKKFQVGIDYPNPEPPSYLYEIEIEKTFMNGELFSDENASGMYAWAHPWGAWNDDTFTFSERLTFCQAHFQCVNAANVTTVMEVNPQGSCHCRANSNVPDQMP